MSMFSILQSQAWKIRVTEINLKYTTFQIRWARAYKEAGLAVAQLWLRLLQPAVVFSRGAPAGSDFVPGGFGQRGEFRAVSIRLSRVHPYFWELCAKRHKIHCLQKTCRHLSQVLLQIIAEIIRFFPWKKKHLWSCFGSFLICLRINLLRITALLSRW